MFIDNLICSIDIVLQITFSVRCAQNFMNRIAGAVISMLASSAVDSGFKP